MLHIHNLKIIVSHVIMPNIDLNTHLYIHIRNASTMDGIQRLKRYYFPHIPHTIRKYSLVYKMTKKKLVATVNVPALFPLKLVNRAMDKRCCHQRECVVRI